MRRRKFLASSLAVSALALRSRSPFLAASGAAVEGSERQYYLQRRYQLRSGSQGKIANDYFRDAFIPAANRLGINPVGVFNLAIGPETPSLYILLPSARLEILVNIESHFQQDSEYLKAGDAFLNAPASSPAFERMRSSLMLAFRGRPRIEPPPATAARGPRTFELRTYESPSQRDHFRKIEMFHSGEFDIFRQAGFSPVFYGDTLIGDRMPQLTYMLAFDGLQDRDKLWAAFESAPAWKKLTSEEKFNFESIVTNVTNLILKPAAYSQI